MKVKDGIHSYPTLPLYDLGQSKEPQAKFVPQDLICNDNVFI